MSNLAVLPSDKSEYKLRKYHGKKFAIRQAVLGKSMQSWKLKDYDQVRAADASKQENQK